MVGDATFTAAVDGPGHTSWRSIVNKHRSCPPMLPGEILGYKHIGVKQAYDFSGPAQAESIVLARNGGAILVSHRPHSTARPGTKFRRPRLPPASLHGPRRRSEPIAMPAIHMNTNATTHQPTLAAAGVTTVGRYYSIYLSKVLTQIEGEVIANAGLSIFVVYEDGANPTTFNASLGTCSQVSRR